MIFLVNFLEINETFQNKLNFIKIKFILWHLSLSSHQIRYLRHSFLYTEKKRSFIELSQFIINWTNLLSFTKKKITKFNSSSFVLSKNPTRFKIFKKIKTRKKNKKSYLFISVSTLFLSGTVCTIEFIFF